MQPGFDLRIASMKKALAEVILPAVDGSNSAAVEQLHLVMGSLDLLLEQMDYANWFEIVDGRSMIAMAGKVEAATGAPLGPDVQSAIASVQDAGSRHDVTLSTLRDANRILRESLSEAIEGILAQADDSAAKAIARIVLDLSADQASRERAFVAKTGFDVFPHSLKSIPEALKASPAA